MFTNLDGRIFALVVELVYLHPQLDLARELGPAVGEAARLGQLLLLHLPVAARAAEARRAMAPHFYGQRALWRKSKQMLIIFI